MKPQIVRPQINDDKREELRRYLLEQWNRALRARQEQVEGDYTKWSRAYSGVPVEEVRTVPFYKASNFVVKLIRIFLDTFMGRTLNVMFATKPLYVVGGLPSDIKDAWEFYLNAKALNEWNHYWVARDMLTRGNKNGTCVVKTLYEEKKSYDIIPDGNASYTEEEYTYFAGPESKVIPFEDFYVYPITAESWDEVEIAFHRVRYVEEAAQRLVDQGVWKLPEDQTVTGIARHPRDIKRSADQNDAGVVDPMLKEVTGIECHLKYAITNEGRHYDIVALLEPESGALLDVYFKPYPRNHRIFNAYRPFPRENVFFGESLCEVLGQSQEEASRIHNERRDNSTLASSVVFKRRSGSLLPNPSTNWYPGKVWDLEDMADLEIVTVGQKYEDMIAQEDYVFNLAERLSGIGEIQQAGASGVLNKRGVYTSMGTMALMNEGNQRQDTNMRDVRCVMSEIARCGTILQSLYNPSDPFIDTMLPDQQKAVRAAMQLFASEKGRYATFEVKASNAGANKEVERINLQTTAQIVNQYGQTVLQLATQLLNPKINPGLRAIMNDIVNMQSWMAKRLLKEFDEWDAAERVPDVAAAIEQIARIPGGSRGTKDQAPGGPSQAMEPGGPGGSLPPLQRSELEALASLAPATPGAPRNGNMG